MTNIVVQERVDEKGRIHRIEIPLTTFLAEHNFEVVVRCRDCKFGDLDMLSGCIFCGDIARREDFFCADGERKEEG